MPCRDCSHTCPCCGSNSRTEPREERTPNRQPEIVWERDGHVYRQTRDGGFEETAYYPPHEDNG